MTRGQQVRGWVDPEPNVCNQILNLDWILSGRQQVIRYECHRWPALSALAFSICLHSFQSLQAIPDENMSLVGWGMETLEILPIPKPPLTTVE